MCGWYLTKIRATRSMVMNGHEFNKCYQIARTWGDMMFVGVNPCSIQIVIFLPHSIYEKNYSLSLKRWSWSSSCLSCMSLVEFLFALLLLLSFLNSCVWVSFPHLLGHVLVVRILTTRPNSHSWCSSSSHSCCSSRSRSCYSSQSYSYCSKFAFLLFQAHILIALFSCVLVAPSSHSSVVLPNYILLPQACVLAIHE